MVGKRTTKLDNRYNDTSALDDEFPDSIRRISEEDGHYDSLKPRDPEPPSTAPEAKVDLPWKNIKKLHPKMQLISKTSRRDSMCYLYTLKFFRLLCFGFCFLLILGSSVMSKLVLSLMSYQDTPNRTMELCVKTPNKLFTVVTSPFERIAWSWALWFVLIIPEVLVFLESAWICIFKKATFPNVQTFCAVFLGETLHVIGICLLVFEVLPSLDGIRGVMFLNSLCFIPGLLTLLSRNRTDDLFHLKISADMVCLVGVMAGTILWAFDQRMWILPITGVLVSCNWWENFVNKDSSIDFVVTLAKYKKKLEDFNRRNFAYLFISLWKILITFLALIIHLVVHSTPHHEELLDYLGYFSSGFRDQPVRLIQAWRASSETLTGSAGDTFTSMGYLPIYLFLFQAGCSLMCYLVSCFACRIGIQEFSFSFAAMISTPIAVFLCSSACSWRAENACFLTNVFPEYVYWQCPSHGFFDTFLTFQHGWVWLVWFASQIWFTAHIWTPSRNPDKLFVIPLYSGAIVEQSLVTNRLNEPVKVDKRVDETIIIEDLYKNDLRRARSNTIIYGCATMWHEEKDEMKDMMKSVMRMDKELRKERLKNAVFDVSMKYNFDFETHIFFDDAFTFKEVRNRKIRVVNNFVKDLVKSKMDAEKTIYGQIDVKIGVNPIIYFTPYGGRLEWTLPGQSKVYVHLKDQAKIKVKKRWSQVMYMFYLLGYLLLDPRQEYNREKAEENTFILALDGDVDFKPDAVQRLLDLMQMNRLLGAACGRIHPVGQGLIPWYQRFEYAIGHWLQKATEHVTGCVLCSPGCFSLFRAKALLEVMETYSQKAKQPKEFVQFDLGEDRWLCTLLLKRGYRIEYSAASDAYTRVPDSFKIFYNQRRRWGPSTMVNIMDILTGWKDTVRINKSISTLYIVYTGLIMAGTVLGPGTIFLMITGSISAAFQVSNTTALLTNLIPITIFVLICFFTPEKIQILFAGILSTLYALLMMAVLIGVIIQLQEDGITSPSGLFLISLSSSFVIAAIIHPQEFHCLKHGILYFLLVPSMYLLLTLYALINMNVITWGTRETEPVVENTNQESPEPDDKIPNSTNKQGSYLANLTKFFDNSNRKESVVSRFCSCFLCTTDQEDEATKELLRKVEIIVEDTNKKISYLERNTIGPRTFGLTSPGSIGDKQFLLPSSTASTSLEPLLEADYGTAKELKKPNTLERQASNADTAKDGDGDGEAGKVNEEEIWAKAKTFEGCDVRKLEKEEETFWKEMIKEYLTPDKKLTKKEKKDGDQKLRDMRNNYIFAFFMLNGLFILVVFLLQMNKDQLYIIWPINAKTNVTYIPVSSVIRVEKEYLHLEPFGFVFALFFGVILVLQFFAMLIHRFGTFTHLMEDTTLSCKVKQSEEFDFDEESGDEKGGEDDDFEDASGRRKSMAPHATKPSRDPSKRRVSIALVQMDQQESETADTLEEAYRNRLLQQVEAARDTKDAPILKKLKSGKMLAIRRMSRDPRFIERLMREDDAESTLSRTNSVRDRTDSTRRTNSTDSTRRTDSTASRFSNGKMFRKQLRGSGGSYRNASNRGGRQESWREASDEDIPASSIEGNHDDARVVMRFANEGFNQDARV